MLFVQNFDARRVRDITRSDRTRAFGIDRQTLRAFDFHAQSNLLEVQNDVGDVFANARYRRELVQNVVDLNGGDGRALQRAHQNAAQRVAERQAKAAL